MILFIAPNPHKIKEHEGYLQRVLAIDELFGTQEKLYSSDCGSDEELAVAVARADLIYVHSIYRSEEIIDCYPVFGHKIITDLHGVVPEEEMMQGEARRSKELDKIERITFSHGAAYVAVTEAMKRHYLTKYSNISKKLKIIVLPIFDDHIVKTKNDQRDNVIYAGGSQAWQNTDLIVNTINNNKFHYNYDILTHDSDAFINIEEKHAGQVTVSSATPEEVKKHYEQAKLGFILRDDVTVNRVACPTKLIEYLCSGVIPIVKYPNIGDFHELGYKYVTLRDFNSHKLTEAEVTEYQDHNYIVIEKLAKITRESKIELTEFVNKIIAKQKNIDIDMSPLLVSAIRNSRNEKELNAAKYQISVQVKMISDYAEAVNYHRRELEELRADSTSGPVKYVKEKFKHIRKLPTKRKK